MVHYTVVAILEDSSHLVYQFNLEDSFALQPHIYRIFNSTTAASIVITETYAGEGVGVMYAMRSDMKPGVLALSNKEGNFKNVVEDETVRLITEIKTLVVKLYVYSPYNSTFNKTANETLDKVRELEKIWKM